MIQLPMINLFSLLERIEQIQTHPGPASLLPEIVPIAETSVGEALVELSSAERLGESDAAIQSLVVQSDPSSTLGEEVPGIVSQRLSPLQLFREVKPYFDQEDHPLRPLVLPFLAEAVDRPIEDWTREIKKGSLSAHRQAACLVAEAYQYGKGLERNDDKARAYFRKAMEPLNSQQENSYIGEISLKAARFEKSKVKEIEDRHAKIIQLMNCIQLFEKSLEARDPLSRSDKLATLSEAAKSYFQASKLIEELEDIRHCKFRAFQLCFQTLEINPTSIERATEAAIAKWLHRTQVKALMILGRLFFEGYYQSEEDEHPRFQTNLSLRCFQRAFVFGNLKSSIWAIKVCVKLSTDDKKREAQTMLIELTNKMRDSTSDEARQTIQLIYDEAKTVFNNKWGGASSGSVLPIRLTMKRIARSPSPSSSSSGYLTTSLPSTPKRSRVIVDNSE